MKNEEQLVVDVFASFITNYFPLTPAFFLSEVQRTEKKCAFKCKRRYVL